MKKTICRRNIRVLLCLLSLFSLLLNGCGRADSGETSEFLTEPGLENSEDLEIESTVYPQEKEHALDIMERIIDDHDFMMCAYKDAGIEGDDREEIIYQKLAQCKSLDLLNDVFHISSLEYLSLMPNLTSLTIDVSCLEDMEKDFTPIAELSKLESLEIWDSAEEMDFSFLRETKSIKELSLCNCQIKDFSFLEDMPQLKGLSLYKTSIGDLAVLEKLSNLTGLKLKGNAEAKNKETIGKLVKLQDLELQDCGIEDIRFLSNLTELKSVNLDDNFIADITPLAGMTKLERLSAENNHIKDISVLSGMSDMYDLQLGNNEISDISALSGMSRLNQVDFFRNRISDLSPLSGKEELMYVCVSGNSHTDITPVQQVPMLYCSNGRDATKEEAKNAVNWMLENHKEIIKQDAVYECIEYAEGDLNQDGRVDAAFVIEGAFLDESGHPDEATRKIFVFLQNEQGAWQELSHNIHYINYWEGGTSLSIFLGEGCLVTERMFISTHGDISECEEFYICQNESLELAKRIDVYNDSTTAGYDVEEKDLQNNSAHDKKE